MIEAEAFRRLEETCSLGHGNTVRKRRDCMTCQVLLLVEVAKEEREACERIATKEFGDENLAYNVMQAIRARGAQ